MLDIQSTRPRELLLFAIAAVVAFTVRHSFPPVENITNVYVQFAIVAATLYIVYVALTWAVFEDGPIWK